MLPGDFALVRSKAGVFGQLEGWWCRSAYTHVVSGLAGGYLDAAWPRLRVVAGEAGERYSVALCSPDFSSEEREAVARELLDEVGSHYSLLSLAVVGLGARAPFLDDLLEPVSRRRPHKALVCSTAYTCAVWRVGPQTYAKLKLPDRLHPHEVAPGHLALAWGLA